MSEIIKTAVCTVEEGVGVGYDYVHFSVYQAPKYVLKGRIPQQDHYTDPKVLSLFFENKTLKEILKIVEREYAGMIESHDSVLFFHDGIQIGLK